MAATKTAHGGWNLANFADPDLPTLPTSWLVRGTPTNFSIAFTLDLEFPGGPIWVEFFGNFPSNILTSIKTVADLVAANVQVNSLKAYFGIYLIEEAAFSPPVSLAQSGILGTQVGYAAEHAGDDTFIGSTSVSAAGDSLYGYAGNDTFYPNNDGASESDIVNGGDGRDTVVYRGKSSEYSWVAATGLADPASNTRTQIGFRVTDKVASRDGDDELVSIERLRFSDVSVALDASGVGGQGYRIYKAAFNRIPDQVGLGYWIGQMDAGMGMVEVAARFIDSPEFRTLYGQNPTNADFLTKVYTNVLGRTPDQGGYDWWLNELNTNPEKTRQKVLADFSESQENKDSVAALIGSGTQFVEFPV
jgi:hypothetical protein